MKNIALCECGPLRQPGEVSAPYAIVNCTRCGLWIEPPDDVRVNFILSGGYLIQTDAGPEGAEILVVKDGGTEAVAQGAGDSVRTALTALEWEETPRFSMEACNTLTEAAYYSPTAGPVPDGLACLGSVDLARGISAWAKDMPEPPWTVEAFGMDTASPREALHNKEGEAFAVSFDPDGARAAATLQGLAYIRQAAPILADRMGNMVGLLQKLLDAVDNETSYPELVKEAAKLGFTPGGNANRPEGAPYCPNCSSFMRPWPLRVPDPNSGQTGRIPGHLCKMVTVHAWRCDCGV